VTSTEPAGTAREEFWRDFLTHGSPPERRLRRFFRLLPTASSGS
jgi:hypothetical protein